MKLSWQTDSDHLECRWSDDNPGDNALPYEAPWVHEQSTAPVPAPPDLAAVSPFGHSEWREERPDTRI